MSDNPYLCSGCGKPYEDRVKQCDCATDCGFKNGNRNDIIASDPTCDKCGGYPVLHNLDGDDLCRACCDKWAASEGYAERELLAAGNALSFAAQTTGGTAGRDEALVSAIDAWTAAANHSAPVVEE